MRTYGSCIPGGPRNSDSVPLPANTAPVGTLTNRPPANPAAVDVVKSFKGGWRDSGLRRAGSRVHLSQSSVPDFHNPMWDAKADDIVLPGVPA